MIKTNGIWQLNRDPSCLAYYEADVGNVVLNTGNVSLLKNSSSIYTESARDAVQATAINQPGYTQSNATFGGHGSVNFSASRWLRTGTFSATIAQPFTVYFVTKFSSGAVDEMVVDGLADGARAAIYCSSTGVPGMFAGSVVTGSGSFRNTHVVGCAIFNGASSVMYWNNTSTPVFSGNPGAQGANGITIGIDRTMTAFQHLGSTAMLGYFTGAHSTGFLAQAMKYLGRRYGGAVT